MTVIFSDDFEGTVAWTTMVKTAGEVIAIVVAPGVLGNQQNKAAQFSTNGVEAGEMCYLQKSLPQAYSEIFVRQYIYCDDIPATGKVSIPLDIRNREASGGAVIAVQLTGSRLYLLYDDATNPTGRLIDSGIDITVHRWYCIEVHAVVSASAGLVQLFVNGNKVAEVLNINNLTTVGPVQIIQTGERWFTGQVVHSLLVDEFIAATAYIGPLAQPPPPPHDNTILKIGAAVATVVTVAGVAGYAISKRGK